MNKYIFVPFYKNKLKNVFKCKCKKMFLKIRKILKKKKLSKCKTYVIMIKTQMLYIFPNKIPFRGVIFLYT